MALTFQQAKLEVIVVTYFDQLPSGHAKAGQNTFFGRFQPFLLIFDVFNDFSSQNKKNS